ncbi:MAG: DUF5069 domain-containing protein [Candidatus Velthaea sp.]|jgi:hypothetical protein
MDAPDLRTGPPRRWNVAVDGIVWLPRLIDKARAHQAGTLGSYLYGQSPIDDGLLARVGLSYPEFLRLATAAPSDAAVLAALEARVPGATERLQRWSRHLIAKRGAVLAVLDWDDGYIGGKTGQALRPVLKPVVDAAMGLLKGARPFRP